jgi:hypothetical protein
MLFAIAIDQEASVDYARRGEAWHLLFRRELGAGDRIEQVNLMREVTMPPTSDFQDKVTWALESSWRFTVRSLYLKASLLST